MLSSISNETLPSNHSFQHSHNINNNSEIIQFGNNELEIRDVNHGNNVLYTGINPSLPNNGCINVIDKQEKLSKDIPE